MEVNINEDRELEITKFYSGILLVSDDKEKFGICLRDSGFEFKYNGEWYEAKGGVIKKLSDYSKKPAINEEESQSNNP